MLSPNRASRTRLRAVALSAVCLLLLAAVGIGRMATSKKTSQRVLPAGPLSELSIDDGVAECALGPNRDLQGSPGFGWANKLTPMAYPATLRTITVGFNRVGPLVAPDKLFRIVVFIDPEGDGPSNDQLPDATFIGRVRGLDSIMVYNLISPVRIQAGSFVVGVIDEFGVSAIDANGNSTFPALLDSPGRSQPRGSESFITPDSGLNWVRLSDQIIVGPRPCDGPGSFLIRATVETGTAEVLSTTRIKDPAAVEPWAVAINGSGTEAFVTNYVSDNLTVINTSNNSFATVAVGDGPGGTADGPFGVVNSSDGRTLYVTLFGSNTIPSKEFPTDYSTVGGGRVQVFTKPAGGGGFAPVTQIGTGKGPAFPALGGVSTQKLYVPCAGSNRVDVIDTATNQKIKEIAVGHEPTSCARSRSGDRIYVTNFQDATVSVIDTRTDQVIKLLEIPAPTGGTGGDGPVSGIRNPWKGEVSPVNGNLYVTFWGVLDGTEPNGGIVEFDTCTNQFRRLIRDDTTGGTAAGSAGASGIAAPTAPLTRSEMTGMTAEAGGGGGGPFGISACGTDNGPLVFTNDGLGLVGVLDSRIDQIVSAPPLAVASCPKPRGIACARVGGRHTAYVACGQPDSSILVVRMPDLPENLPNVPVIDSVLLPDGELDLLGSFSTGSIVELLGGNSGCIGFKKNAKVKKGIRIIQKGKLTDGSSIADQLRATSLLFVRVVGPDGTVRLGRCCIAPAGQ